MRLIGGLVSLILLLAIGGAGFALWVNDYVNRPGPLAEQIVLEVLPGSSVDAIATMLEQHGIISNVFLFNAAKRLFLQGESLKAGEYAIPVGASVRDVLALLAVGASLPRRLMIPEGLTSAEVAVLVDKAVGLTGKVEGRPAEGSLLPETYYFTKGDTRASVIARMETALDDVVGELWPSRAEGLPFDTAESALILASIVEKETGVASERAHVAGVFVNRLHKGMRLQSDPTVIYGLTDGDGVLGRSLTRADLDRDHPYNTYRIPGLPPGPIANPGRASIAAVLNPLDTEDLFFVADGNGGHVFARTLKEHNRNVAKWRRVKREAAKAGN